MLLDIIESRFDLEEAKPNLNLSDLAQDLASLRDHDREPLARALSSTLRHGRITKADGASSLGSLITTSFLAPHPQPPTQETQKAATHALEALASLAADCGQPLSPADLIRVAAYTNANDPWTCPEAIVSATTILEAHLNTPQKLRDFIKSTILESYLRPLFSRSRSERITSTGRKAHFPAADAGRGENLTEDKTSPWKTGDVHAVTVFGWAVDNSDEQLIQESWPLYIPVLLALLDDAETKYRARGLQIVRTFLRKYPGARLKDTGLGDIIADSIMPTFNFLPSLTPEDESVVLLDAAFPAIVQLARSQFGRPEDTAGKRALLGKLLRDGVFTGYWHANQYVRVVEVLARQSAVVVDELGLAATPYLKDLIPMYTEILSDPFLVRVSGSLLAAAQGLKATMRNCWPRISTPDHQGEILKALTVGWLSLQEESGSPRDEQQQIVDEKLRAELTEAARMLAAISSAAGIDLESQTSQLCAKDKSLEDLFGTSVSA